MVDTVEKKFRLTSLVAFVVYDGLLNRDELIIWARQLGIQKCFIKWHKSPKDHTHLIILLIDKPDYKDAYKKFTFQGVRPNLVDRGKGAKQLSCAKKFTNAVTYLCDGHDNGRYQDTTNYKYDHELL